MYGQAIRPTRARVVTVAGARSGDAPRVLERVGREPKPFAIDTSRSGHLSSVAKCSLATVLRLGAGALVNGYSISLAKQERVGGYALIKAGPLASVERGAASGGAGGGAGGPEGGNGNANANGIGKAPQDTLVMFAKMDGPGRKVREALSILDVDCIVYPSTRSWERLGFDHRRHAITLRDPNTDAEYADADDIVAYLFETFGGGPEIPWILRRDNAVGEALLKVAIWLRGGSGTTYNGGKGGDGEQGTSPDPTSVEFWGYEASPFCGVAYEAVIEAGIPHVLKTVARGSSKRNALFEAEGHFQVGGFSHVALPPRTTPSDSLRLPPSN